MVRASTFLLVGVLTSAGPASPPGLFAQDSKDGKAPSIDEIYVRDHLKEYLHPTKLEFLGDGRVKMSFNFYRKNPDHETIFQPNIGKSPRDAFRWALPGDWWYGLKIGDKGMAMMNLWFTEDLEAELRLWPGTSYSNRQIMALVYQTDKGTALGSNFGQQVGVYRRGRARGAKGTREPLLMDQSFKMKLKVKDGVFESHFNGRKSASMEYPRDKFPSGRLGFLWGGGVAMIVRELTIVGKLDHERMAKEMRKADRRK